MTETPWQEVAHNRELWQMWELRFFERLQRRNVH